MTDYVDEVVTALSMNATVANLVRVFVREGTVRICFLERIESKDVSVLAPRHAVIMSPANAAVLMHKLAEALKTSPEEMQPVTGTKQ